MKKGILNALLFLIFIVVFNVVFFVATGTAHAASVWIAYIFIHIAFLMVVITPFLIRSSSSASVFNISLYSIASTYFLLEFVVGVIFIFIKSESYKASLIFQIIIAGIYGVLLVSNLLANEHTADSIEKHEDEVAYIKNASSLVKVLVGKSSEKQANKAIERVYDQLHSSPVKSAPAARTIEELIVSKVAELDEAVSLDNSERIIAVSEEVLSLIEERNRKICLEN